MLSFLKLIRFDNIILVAFAQLCIKYGIFLPTGIDITLNGFGIALIVLATMSIMIAGNIIIALYEPDNFVTQPISERAANRWFIICNAIGVLLGFYLANLIQRPGFAALFIISSGVLYLYASYLKELLIVKNLIPSILIALSLLVVPIFDLLPAITDQNRASQTVIFSIISDYALFAFTIIYLREVIKDCLHIDKDHNRGLKTIPITIGKDRTTKLISIATLIPLAMVIYYIYTYFFSNTTMVMLILIGIVAPLLLFMIKSWGATTQKNYNRLSLILKMILFITTLSILFYPYILS